MTPDNLPGLDRAPVPEGEVEALKLFIAREVQKRVREANPSEEVKLTVSEIVTLRHDLGSPIDSQLIVFGTKMIEAIAKNPLLTDELERQVLRFSDGVDQVKIPMGCVVTDDRLGIEWTTELFRPKALDRSEFRITLFTGGGFDAIKEEARAHGNREHFSPKGKLLRRIQTFIEREFPEN